MYFCSQVAQHLTLILSMSWGPVYRSIFNEFNAVKIIIDLESLNAKCCLSFWKKRLYLYWHKIANQMLSNIKVFYFFFVSSLKGWIFFPIFAIPTYSKQDMSGHEKTTAASKAWKPSGALQKTGKTPSNYPIHKKRFFRSKKSSINRNIARVCWYTCKMKNFVSKILWLVVILALCLVCDFEFRKWNSFH